MAGRLICLIYGAAAYAIFLVIFLYAIGFINQQLVPKDINDGEQGELWAAVAINVALLGLFGIQHSVTARPFFKRWFNQFAAPPVERITFVLATSLILALLFWQWRPIPQVVWSIDHRAAGYAVTAVSLIGWLIALASTFMVDHFELFGLKGAYQYFTGREAKPPEFRQPLFYRYVRHPIMLGFLIAFWAAPVMTAGHLLFAVVTTAYVLIALQVEEHDLVGYFGEDYRIYQQRVPMLLPLRFGRRDD